MQSQRQAPPPRTPPQPQHVQQNRQLQVQDSHRGSAPHPLLSGTVTQQWRSQQPHATRALSLRRWTRNTRSSGRWDSEAATGTPPPEDKDADSDLDRNQEAPAGGAPAWPAPPVSSVQALCPAWKRGHCTGEGSCPRQQPWPAIHEGAVPAVGHAAACAALRYSVAQGWIQDETTRNSVNIQEAVDLVANMGQTEVALHIRGRHGGPPEAIVVKPTGIVLVLAAEMVRGVLHASGVRRARPQWTIQVYTPPRASPLSTWAVLAVMWHLAPEGNPIGSAEEIARDLHAWPADQHFP